MRILFIGPTYIGDAVVASGLLDHLARVHPAAEITVVCGKSAVPVLANMPGVVKVIPVVKQKRRAHWWGVWKQTAGVRWDMVVDLRSSGLAYVLRAKRRCVYWRKKQSPHHRTALWAQTIGLSELPQPRLRATDAEQAQAAQLAPDGPPILALAPSANWQGKIWQIENFRDLALRLTADAGPLAGGRVAVLGIESERPGFGPLLDAIPDDRLIDLTLPGRTALMLSYAVLQRAALYVGNDSGLLYMAVAADIPAVGLVGPSLHLFGPETPTSAAPWAPKAVVVHTPITYEEFLAQPGYNRLTTGSLMGSLTVDAAYEGALQALALGAGAPALAPV